MIFVKEPFGAATVFVFPDMGAFDILQRPNVFISHVVQRNPDCHYLARVKVKVGTEKCQKMSKFPSFEKVLTKSSNSHLSL